MPGDEVVAVTTEQSGHVVLVNVATGEIVTAFPTEGDVSHMLAIPGSADLIYTSDIRDATVTEIEVARGATVRKFQVPVTPEAVGVTPDGSEVWVGSNELGIVSVIDTESGEVVQALEGFGWPYRVVFSEDGRTVLLPDLRGDELRIVGTPRAAPRRRASPSPVADRRAWCSRRTGSTRSSPSARRGGWPSSSSSRGPWSAICRREQARTDSRIRPGSSTRMTQLKRLAGRTVSGLAWIGLLAPLALAQEAATPREPHGSSGGRPVPCVVAGGWRAGFRVEPERELGPVPHGPADGERDAAHQPPRG